MRFPVVLHSDDGVRYGVTVPDLPGCFSAGDTFDDALGSVVEAIVLHLEGVTEEGGDDSEAGSAQGNFHQAQGIGVVVYGQNALLA